MSLTSLIRTGSLAAAGWLAIATAASAQELHQAPDYSDSSVIEGAEQAAAAWNAWVRGDRDLERELVNAPMAETREKVQRSFSAFLNYIDKRRIYGERVASYIERYRPETAGRRPFVNVEVVNRDQLELLGVSLSGVQARLNSLRDTPVWSTVRRAVQADTSETITLQGARRDQLPPVEILGPAVPLRPLSVIVYRDSERQVREAVLKIWTHYYQSLADALDQRPGATRALITSIGPSDAGVEAAAAPALPEPGGNSPLAGTWRYREGSQKYNGVDEPRRVMLELSSEKGQLTGRYRGTLADFSGSRDIDVRLQQVAAAKGSSDLRFQFLSPEQNLSGQLIIEGPASGGTEIMVVHMSASGLPRGREILERR